MRGVITPWPHVRTSSPWTDIPVRDKKLYPTEYYGMHLLIPAWETCFWHQSPRINHDSKRDPSYRNRMQYTLLTDIHFIWHIPTQILPTAYRSFDVYISRTYKKEKQNRRWYLICYIQGFNGIEKYDSNNALCVTPLCQYLIRYDDHN